MWKVGKGFLLQNSLECKFWWNKKAVSLLRSQPSQSWESTFLWYHESTDESVFRMTGPHPFQSFGKKETPHGTVNCLTVDWHGKISFTGYGGDWSNCHTHEFLFPFAITIKNAALFSNLFIEVRFFPHATARPTPIQMQAWVSSAEDLCWMSR